MKKITIFLFLICIVVMFSGCGSQEINDVNSTTEGVGNNIAVVDDTNSVSESNKVIYTDDIMSVDFISFSDNVIDGMFDLCIKVNNVSNENITVYIKDFRVDSSTVEVGSGVPCDIVSGANRTHNFFGRLDLAGLESAKNATELTFKIWVVNESMETLITTEDLIVTL